ncbi:MAG: hypothetical protein AAGB97_00090 [Dehalococcoidia bacterium]
MRAKQPERLPTVLTKEEARDGKGMKDRVKRLHAEDLGRGHGSVYLPRRRLQHSRHVAIVSLQTCGGG